MNTTSTYQHQPDIVCLSHLRWNFVFQRPQHLMSRFAKDRRVFFVEEPIFDTNRPTLETSVCSRTNVHVVTPHLDGSQNSNRVLKSLLAEFMRTNNLAHSICWFYTPMALEFFPDRITPASIIYDCMDELSMFRGAPPQLQALERLLLHKADLVFTGGASLFEAKRHLHADMHPFPSGVDVPHFMKARNLGDGFAEQKDMARPRLGFAGVIDERLDLPLLAEVAARRPDWELVMIGPTAKIAPESLPRAANIHWLGMKDYNELPNYFAGWDVAMMPFALNDSTRFISPTKTPEFLAAGLPVVSTAIRDVVRPYGELGLVRIAESPAEFIQNVERALAVGMSLKWRERADQFLGSLSWDSVWAGMNRLIMGRLQPQKTFTAGSAATAQAGPEVAHG